jgi:hypothetical protein
MRRWEQLIVRQRKRENSGVFGWEGPAFLLQPALPSG